jgi:proteasome lid subunit RPN8/RPN11
MKEARVVLNPKHINETLSELRRAGSEENRESVVLWLGKRNASDFIVSEVFIPIQNAGEDFFHIPPEGMTELMSRIKAIKGMVVAQVHSHPGLAFHSKADDKWAIIRHEKALSIVVPKFGLDCSPDSFFKDVKAFQFIAPCWTEISQTELHSIFEVSNEC